MKKFEANWESLSAYEVPQWFKDAKLGIFIHWGAYSVPAFSNEWYPKNMYMKDSPEFKHHLETWGPQKDFGYKDFIPMFKGEKFDPKAWVELFEASGAKYVVPVAEHHDGLTMYDTDLSRWTAAKQGPKRDIVRELEKEVRGKGLKFGVSSHRAFHWKFFAYDDSFDTVDPEFEDLYNTPHGEDDPASEAFLADWWKRTTELIDEFDPDVLWFDFGWHQPEYAPYWPKTAAYYYNHMADLGKGAVLQYKDKFPENTAVFDVERGKLQDIREHYWQTDTSVSYQSWSHVTDDEFKSPETIIHDLVDIVSKNGNLLLNVGPRADGTIPEEAQSLLLKLGGWLKVNGEAIYGTRPWKTFGEGDAKVVLGHLTEKQNQALTVADIRFTTKEDALFAIFPGWSEDGFTIATLAKQAEFSQPVKSVSMLGSGETLEWEQTDEGLRISAPAQKPCDFAWVFKIEFE